MAEQLADPLWAPLLYVGEGLSWTFLRPSPPMVHLVSTDGRHLLRLTSGAARVLSPSGRAPSERAQRALFGWLERGGREQVELAWLRVAITRGWVHVEVRDTGDLEVDLCPDYPEASVGALIERARCEIEPVPHELEIDLASASLVLGKDRPAHRRQRWPLAELFWRGPPVRDESSRWSSNDAYAAWPEPQIDPRDAAPSDGSGDGSSESPHGADAERRGLRERLRLELRVRW
jgi:hypothetical protein